MNGCCLTTHTHTHTHTHTYIYIYIYGPMLVTEPNVVWLLVRLLVAIVFVTTKLASVCFVKSFRAHTVFERSTEWGWHNSGVSSSDGQVILVARLSSNSKNRENPLFNNNKKSFLLKHVCETMNKQCLISWQKGEERTSREEEWRWSAVTLTLMSLKSGTLNFCKVWSLFGVPRV